MMSLSLSLSEFCVQYLYRKRTKRVSVYQTRADQSFKVPEHVDEYPELGEYSRTVVKYVSLSSLKPCSVYGLASSVAFLGEVRRKTQGEHA